MKTPTAVLLVLAFGTAAPAAVGQPISRYRNETLHFTLSLPPGWRQMTVEELTERMNALTGGKRGVNYDAAFKPSDQPEDTVGPVVLVHHAAGRTSLGEIASALAGPVCPAASAVITTAAAIAASQKSGPPSDLVPDPPLSCEARGKA